MIGRDVHLFLFDTLSDRLASFAAAGIPDSLAKGLRGRHRVVTVAPTRAPIITRGGLPLLPDITLDELSPARSAMLILPGGEAWDGGGNQAAIAKTKEFIAACVPVAAICSATLGLARAGLLNNRYHTGDARADLAASGYRGGRLYREVPAVSDQGVITASGAAPLEFARAIFAELDLYSPCALEAWYAQFKCGEVSSYAETAQYACR